MAKLNFQKSFLQSSVSRDPSETNNMLIFCSIIFIIINVTYNCAFFFLSFSFNISAYILYICIFNLELSGRFYNIIPAIEWKKMNTIPLHSGFVSGETLSKTERKLLVNTE